MTITTTIAIAIAITVTDPILGILLCLFLWLLHLLFAKRLLLSCFPMLLSEMFLVLVLGCLAALLPLQFRLQFAVILSVSIALTSTTATGSTVAMVMIVPTMVRTGLLCIYRQVSDIVKIHVRMYTCTYMYIHVFTHTCI